MNLYKSKIKLDGVDKTLVCFNYKEEQQQVTNEVTVDRVHHIQIIDRSGSMYGEIKGLIENVKQTIDMIPDGDLISIIWFSSPGQCEVLVKGVCRTEQSAKDIKKLLDTIASVLGCTCFSEPLEKTNKIIDELKAMCENYSITFFTDGCTVTPWSDTEEENRIFKQLEEMKNKVMALTTIGYGYYYNEDLLKRMAAETIFGRQIHSSKINEYSEIFDHTYKIISDMVAEKVEVKSNKPCEILYLSDKTTKITNNEMVLDFLAKKKNQFFILLDDETTFNVNGTEYNTTDINTPILEATLKNFYYAYAYEMYYRGKTDLALELIALVIKDKYLADALMNAFTVDERHSFIKEFNRAVLNRKAGYRYKTGEAPTNYIPREDVFCFMDLIRILQTGNNYYEPVKEYNRIGRQVTDEFNLFEANKDEVVLASFDDMVFNQKHLNMSIRFKINGSVKLNPKQAKEVGLDPVQKAHIYRVHTLIKDGNLNVTRFNAYLDNETYEKLLSMNDLFDNGIITTKNKANVFGKEFTVVEIDLTNLPIINRKYAKASDDISYVLDIVVRVNELKAKQKVVKYFIDKIKNECVEAKSTGAFRTLTAEQIKILEAHGLNDKMDYNGIDNQKAEKNENDFYISRLLEFSLKGWSSLPKIEDSLAKVKNGKKLNGPDTVIVNYVKELESNGLAESTKENKEALESILKGIKNEIAILTVNLNIIRLAKVLTNSWWTGLTPDKDNFIYENNGNTLVIKNDRVKIYY